MMKPHEQLKEMMDWLMATSHDEELATFDMGIGDASKSMYFRRHGLDNLSINDIDIRTSFFRAVNTVGVEEARRPLNVYICSAKSQPQSWLMMDDLTIEQCREIAGNRTAMIIQTSATSHHLWLATSRPVSVAERKLCQQVLQKKYGGDEGSVSGDHFGRLAGFKSIKRNCWVNLICLEITDRKADVDKLLAMADELGLDPLLSPMGVVDLCQPQVVASSLPISSAFSPALVNSKPITSSPTQSSSAIKTHQTSAYQPSSRDEHRAEFAFACAHFEKKLDLEKGIQSLAQRALDRGKGKTWPSAEAYARTTFKETERASNR